MLFKSWTRPAGAAACLITALAILLTRQPAAAAGLDASHFPNIALTTQEGKTVHFYDDLIKGKIVAIDFIYTTCQYACPLETARLVQVQKKLGDRVGKDIFFYSISIDPERDTPEALRAYMEKFHVGPGWTFLTGKKTDIDFLSKRLGLWAPPSVNKDGHMPHLLIGNEATGQWMRTSALDNPSFQARMIGDFLDNFKHDTPAEQPGPANGQALAQFDQGQYLFSRQCIACHTIGRGDTIGPDLLGVTSVRDRKWLLRMIQTPEQMLNGQDPIAAALLKKYNNVRMPNILVSDVDAAHILGYIESRTAAYNAQAAADGAATIKSPLTSKGNARPNH